MRPVDGKRIFAVIGLTTISLVIALLLMLYVFDRDDAQASMELGETFVFKELETEKIDKNVQKRQDRLERFKRQLLFNPNPIQYDDQPPVDYLRQKRLSDLHEIQMKLDQCRNSNPIPNDCEKFHREMVEIHQALDYEIRNNNFGRSYDGPNYAVDESNVENFGKFSAIPDVPADFAMHEMNREDKVLQSANDYSPFPKFHEDLENRPFNAWNVNEPPQDAPELSMPPPIPTFGSVRDNEKINPLKAQNFGKEFE